MKCFKSAILLLFFALFFGEAHSQNTVLKDTGFWFQFSSKAKLSERFYVLNVFELRAVEFQKHVQGYFILSGLQYKINKNVHVGAGYLYFKFHSYGANHPVIPKEEHRIWQNVRCFSQIGNVKLAQRVVFEERFKDKIVIEDGQAVISGTTYAQRIRYRARMSFNLFQLKNDKFISARVEDEIRFRFKNGLSNSSFDQNNLSLFVGYKLLPNSTILLGYGLDYFKIKSDKFLLNNTLRLNLSYNFDFTKKKKV